MLRAAAAQWQDRTSISSARHYGQGTVAIAGLQIVVFTMGVGGIERDGLLTTHSRQFLAWPWGGGIPLIENKIEIKMPKVL